MAPKCGLAHLEIKQKTLLATCLLLLLATDQGKAEVYFSVLAGPSVSLAQDIKLSQFDASGNMIKREVLYSETSLSFSSIE